MGIEIVFVIGAVMLAAWLLDEVLMGIEIVFIIGAVMLAAWLLDGV